MARKDDVFDLPLGNIKLTDFAAELTPAQRLLRATAPPATSSFGRAGRTVSERQRTKMQKQLEAQAAAQALAAIPKWDTVRAGLQGYDTLPYSEQRRLYDDYATQYVATAKAANPDADEFAISEQLRQAQPPPVEPTRTYGEVATDVGSGVASGLESFWGSLASAIDPAGDAAVASRYRNEQRMAGRSAVEQDRQKQIAFELAQIYDDPDASAVGKFLGEAGVQVSNLSAAGVAELAGGLLPSLLAGGGIGAGVRYAALRAGARASVAATRGAAAATGTGVALEAGSTGGEAAAQAFQTVMDAPIEELQKDEKWAPLLEATNGDEDAARAAMAGAVAREAQAWGTGLGALLAAAPGSLERRVGAEVAGAATGTAGRGLGRRAAGVVGTAGLEGATEAVGPISANIATGNENLIEGAGGDFALGAIAGTGGTVATSVAGRRLGRRQQPAPPAATDPVTAAQERIAGLTGSAEEATDEPAPITEPAELMLGGARVVIQPDGAATYAEGETPNDDADAFIAAQNAQLAPEGEAAERLSYTPELQQLGYSDGQIAGMQPDHQAQVVAQNVTPDGYEAMFGQSLDALEETAAAIENETAQARAAEAEAAALAAADQLVDDEAPPVEFVANENEVGPALARLGIEEDNPAAFAAADSFNDTMQGPELDAANSALTLPASTLQRNNFAGLQAAQQAIASLTPQARTTLAVALPEEIGPVESTVSPAGFFVNTLGMGLEVGDYQSSTHPAPAWVAELTSPNTNAARVLDDVATDRSAGLANNDAAGYVQSLFRLSGVPFPTVRYSEAHRNARGSYSPSTHRVSYGPTTTPNTVVHEMIHALTARGVDQVQVAAESGNQEAYDLLALMEYVRQRLMSNAGGSVYGTTNAHEMLAELVRPEFLALAARTPLGTPPAHAQRALGRMRPNATVLDAIVRMVTKILSYLPNVQVSENNVLDVLVRAAAEFNGMTAGLARQRAQVGTPQDPNEPPPGGRPLPTDDVAAPPQTRGPASARANPFSVPLRDLYQRILNVSRDTAGSIPRGLIPGLLDELDTIPSRGQGGLSSEERQRIGQLIGDGVANSEMGAAMWAAINRLDGTNTAPRATAAAAPAAPAERRSGSLAGAVPQSAGLVGPLRRGFSWRAGNVQRTARFAEPIDAALYIVRRGGTAARRADYQAWLQSLGFSDTQISALSEQVRAAARTQAQTGTGEFTVPSIAVANDVLLERPADGTIPGAARPAAGATPARAAAQTSQQRDTTRDRIRSMRQRIASYVSSGRTDRGAFSAVLDDPLMRDMTEEQRAAVRDYLQGTVDMTAYLSTMRPFYNQAGDTTPGGGSPSTAAPSGVRAQPVPPAELARSEALLLRLGDLFARLGRWRGVAPQGALGTLIRATAPSTERRAHFHDAMRAGIDALNAASLDQRWTYLNSGDRFSVTVNGREVADGTVSDAGHVTTTGFQQGSGLGGRFYDVFYGALISSRIRAANHGLTAANTVAMPVNRLRAALKWGRVVNNVTLANDLLNRNDLIPTPMQAGSFSQSLLGMMSANVRAQLNEGRPLEYDPVTNTITYGGNSYSPSQLLQNTTGRRNLSPDVIALVALSDTLAAEGTDVDALLANATAPGNRVLFSDPEAPFTDLALESNEDPDLDDVLYSEPVTSGLPGVSAAAAVSNAATEEGADNLIGDTPVPSERMTPPQLVDHLTTGRAAEPATVPRGTWQALQRGDWAGAITQFLRFGDYLNTHLHDHLVPVKRWIERLQVSEQLRDRIINALYTAPNIRDRRLSESLVNGGRDLRRVIAQIASASNMTIETATQQVGYWLTAQRAPTGNAHLLAGDAAAVKAAQAAYDRAPSPAAARAIRDATQQLQDRTRAVLNPRVNVRTHTGGGVAGFNNAQARTIASAIESRISPELLQQAARAAYTLNAWRLTTDVETGKTHPDVAAAFLREPTIAPLLNSLHTAAQNVDAGIPESVTALEALREQVMATVRSNYVPLTGDPDAALDADLFQTGTRQPNVARDYRLQGRTSSIPDDAVTATWASVLKSASYAGWTAFQDAIADAYTTMTPEAREHAGLYRTTVERGSGPMESAIIRRRGNTTHAYRLRDPALLEAIRGANIDSNAVLMNGFTKLTRAYSFAATQLNIFFAPKNWIRDSWERSELLRTRTYRDADGAVIDSTQTARRMIQHLFNVGTLTATGRGAFGLEGKTAQDRYLAEFMANGGISLFSDRFNSSRINLIQGILNERNGQRQLRKAWDYTFGAWNKSFEMGPALAAYMALRDAGVTAADAAAGSLDLMNFRKRGQSMALPNALYAFAQPAVTGGANALSALYNPRTGKIVPRGWIRLATYTAVFMAAQAFFRSLADEDEGGNRLDQQSPLVQNSHLLIPMGNGLIKVPLAFGLTRVANGAARALIGAGTGEMTPGEAAGTWFKGSVTPVFSPIESTDIDWQERPVQAWLTTFMPTFLKPVLSVGLNLTPWGTPVVKDDYAETDQYRSEQFGKGVAPEYQAIARSLREWTGVDFAPEEVKTLIRGYPMGPATLAWQGIVENEYADSRGRPTTNPLIAQVYANYSGSARYFQFQEALHDTDSLLKRYNVGDTEFNDQERRALAWRRAWDEQDQDFRTAKGRITRDRTLTEQAKQQRKDAIQRRREQAQVLALYNYRVVTGQPAKRADVPNELLPPDGL